MATTTERIHLCYLDRLRTAQDRSLFDKVYDLYIDSFPEDSEREEKSQWERALTGSTDYSFALIIGRSLSRVVGGIALEYYPESRAGLLTFVFVHPDYRCRGFARELVRRGCHRLKERGAAHVFAEAENPEIVEEVGIKSSIDPRLRLRILDRLGAKRVNIDYVQPPLGPGKLPAEHLMLLKMSGENENSIGRDVLTAFLTEFYRVLGLDDLQTEQRLHRTFAGMHSEAISLTPLV